MLLATVLVFLVLALHLVLLALARKKSLAREGKTVEDLAMVEALVRNSPRGIHMYRLDDRDRLVFSGYNPSADRILGLDHSLLVGKTIEEAFPPLAATEIPERYLEAARDGIPWSQEQVEYEDKAVKGAFEIVAFQTKPRAMAVVFSDITGRKKAEAELQALNLELERQRSYTESILGSLPAIFYLYEYPELRLVSWNKNHETALGFEAAEMRGRDLRDWHIPEARGAVVEAVERCMREGEASIEAPLVAKDGRRIPYLLTGKPFLSEGRSYLMGVGIDITERVAAEERLQALNQELEARVADRTSRLSEANTALETALVQLKESQERTLASGKMAALGRLIASLAHELNTPLGAILSATAASSTDVSGLDEVLELCRSFDEAEAEAFRKLSGRLPSMSAWDRTEERQLRKRYRVLLEEAGLGEAAALAEELTELPFSGSDAEILALARLPRFGALVGAAFRAGSIQRSNYVIGVAAQKMARVVGALRTYARSEPDERLVPDDIHREIDDVLLILESRMRGEVEVVRNYGPVPPVPCHPDRLAQVWMNLLTNALHAMDYRGRLEITTRSEGGRVEATVTDDGCGISEEARSRIFEPFYTTKIAGEGLGLGLDICRRILEEIGGTISFESRPGRTSFTVSLDARNGGGA